MADIIDNNKNLIEIARSSIEYGLTHHQPIKIQLNEFAPSLREEAATFVTLNMNNELRGCIGQLTASRPLAVDVAMNAYAAAFQDPRFPPLKKEELPLITISISLLSKPEPLVINSEAELLTLLRPGIDGLIIEKDQRRGTFLPSVWAQLPAPKAFLRQLKLKAGINENDSASDIVYFRYTTTYIEE